MTPIELRHRLHSTPELMFQEFETTKIIFDAVSKLENIIIHRPLETGLVVEYTVNKGDYLLFRADIDALPIIEKTGVEFASTNGCMHACGHDVHTSILYGFLLDVLKRKVNQNIIFVFQPGEEGGGGAEQVIKSGVLDKFNITNAYALHVTDEYSLGTVASTEGVLFASAIEVDFIIKGKASHIAFPERGINAMKALRLFLDNTDDIIAQYEEPVLFGCGKVTSGVIRNVIPAEAKAEGTLRTLSVDKLNGILSKFTEELEALKENMGIDYEMNLSTPYTEVVVSHKLFEECKEKLETEFEFIDCGYKMTAEDFGMFSRKYPAFMFWLGTSKGERYGLHTPNFFPDDSVIEKGEKAFNLIMSRR